MHQPCRTCPFREKPVQAGAADWLIDLIKGMMSGGLDHSCHLTDRKADKVEGDRPTKKKRHCIGYLGMMKRSGWHAIGRKAVMAMASGEIDWDKIPTKGVFASPTECIVFHGTAIGMKFDDRGRPIQEEKTNG